LLVSGKSLGGGLPLAGVTGNAEAMDAPHVGGLGGTFGGNPAACAAAAAVLDEVATPEFRSRSDELGRMLRERLDELAERVPQIGEVRGLGPMCALELVEDRKSKLPATELAKTTAARALERGLILLTCGLHGNVVRVLVPLVVSDEDLARGLEILEEALVGAGR
jgi:4-aminobutyrate aminotransferase-like enzyme